MASGGTEELECSFHLIFTNFNLNSPVWRLAILLDRTVSKEQCSTWLQSCDLRGVGRLPSLHQASICLNYGSHSLIR